MKTAIVILAGGTGTRLWPLSRNNKPKQFTSILDDKTLIQNTYDRLSKQYNNSDIFVSTNINFIPFLERDLPQISKENYILEPCKMDRTAAFGLITMILKDKGYSTVILVASDDYIGNVDEYLRVLKIGEEVNQKNSENLLLIGISPDHPATGYGYIEMGDPVSREGKDIIFNVQSFKEKPDRKTAEKFISDWRYLWNSGWFVFNPEFLLEKYKELVPNTYEHLLKCYKLSPETQEFIEEYKKCDAITFDVAIAEKLDNTLVLPASVGFSDIGSWKLIKDIQSEDEHERNIFTGNVISSDTESTYVYSSNKKKVISVLGLKDIVIVDTEDALLVTTIDKSQDVKKIVEQLPDELK